MNKDNLTKLAEGLLTVPEHQFDIETFHSIFDENLFQQFHPELASRIYEDYEYLEEFEEELMPDFQIQHNCGTSGCALGWAPVLVEKGLEGENWNQYSERVFGISSMSPPWDFMFGPNWQREQNSPKATSKRIMYVVHYGIDSVMDRLIHDEIAKELNT